MLQGIKCAKSVQMDQSDSGRDWMDDGSSVFANVNIGFRLLAYSLLSGFWPDLVLQELDPQKSIAGILQFSECVPCGPGGR